MKTELEDQDRDEKGKRTEMGQIACVDIVQGTKEKLPAAVKQMKQEPGNEEEWPEQYWEAKWQDFLKTLQAPYLGRSFPQLSPPHSVEASKECQAVLKEGAEPILWPGGLSQPLSGLSKDTQETLNISPDVTVKVKEEIPDEDTVSLEEQRQRFRTFGYQEAEGPRDACRQLQELCSQWLNLERCTKEQILEQVILEQFLTILPEEVQSWVREGGPRTCAQAVTLAEDFLLGLKRRQGQELEAFQEVIVRSPKMEQEPSDAEDMDLFMDVEPDGDGDSNLLTPDAMMKEDETPQSERSRSLKSTGMTMGKFIHNSPFSGNGEKTHILQPRKVDANEISLEIPEGTHLHVPRVEKRPVSEHGLQTLQENPLVKMLRQHVGGREEGRLDFNTSLSQDRATEYLLENTGIVSGPSFAPSTNLFLPAMLQGYECSYCGKRWQCRSELLRHLRTHTGERPHKCSDCGKSFSTSSHLIQHKRVHTGERPYSCKDCGKSYRRRASLVQHEREKCQKGSPLNAPALPVGYVVLGNCTLLCMKKTAQGRRNRAIAPKGGEAPLAGQPLNILTDIYPQERSDTDH
ncbi:zinc finger protein 165 isoform X2 [Anolis carolinensis]